MLTKKEKAICALRAMLSSLERSDEVVKFNFDVISEVQVEPTECGLIMDRTNWIEAKIGLRYQEVRDRIIDKELVCPDKCKGYESGDILK